ncbi:hypothetical protein BANRA_05712 [Klebsiella pneumoniae]|nr:hypothetical protein BANRA_05712 [Klebsiella pneumoniae]
MNDPENVRQAFTTYDKGAHIDEVQDLNVVYEIKERLDEHGLYDEKDLAAFKEARFKTIRVTHTRHSTSAVCRHCWSDGL